MITLSAIQLHRYAQAVKFIGHNFKVSHLHYTCSY